MTPLLDRTFLELQAWQWLGLAVFLAAAVLLALGAGAVVRRVALALARRTEVDWDELLVETLMGPARALLGLGVFAGGVRTLYLAGAAEGALDLVLRVLLVLVVTWTGLRGVRFVVRLLEARLVLEEDPLAVRGVKTQIAVLGRVAGVLVVVLGGALVLLQFPGLRTVGTSMLASAGVAGIVLGLAAQRSIATLLAGLQLSITQPVRIGDVVIIEGEWGTIEEITLTYVVVKIWDLRRLVVPITRFLEAPFQNWTRTGSEILGTVFVYADYRVPVDEVRREVEAFVKDRPEWDGKVAGLVATNATDRTVELRALVSAADSGKAWDLRCALREHLIGWLARAEGGRHLPRTRVEGEGPLGPAA